MDDWGQITKYASNINNSNVVQLNDKNYGFINLYVLDSPNMKNIRHIVV